MRNQVFLVVFDQLSKGYKELDEDQEMVSPAQVCAMFIDWTDPQKAMYETDATQFTRPNNTSLLCLQRGRGSDSRPDGPYGHGNLSPSSAFQQGCSK